MTAPTSDFPLDAIRREIDSIDGQILALLVQRFAATEKVRISKIRDGSLAASPFRPAREAVMMRRLIAGASPELPADVLVRLWRVILSASIQSQAPVTLHMHAALGHDLATRIQVAQHFCAMSVALHDTPTQALDALRSAQGDLALIAPLSDWVSTTFPHTDGARVIGTLPVLENGGPPQFLVLGHAEPQPTGDDETLIILPAEAPQPPGAAWLVRSGTVDLVGLTGFFMDSDPQLTALVTQFPGARVAGRYPRPIKVSP